MIPTTLSSRLVLTLVILSLFAGVLAGQPAPALTADAAQQAMRALPALPLPADQLKVTDTMQYEGRWIASVDFAGMPVHVRFKRAAEKWTPEEMSYRGGWLPIARGLVVFTERDEAVVQSTLRAIASGQLTYAAVCSDGFYAPTLRALATPQAGDSTGFIGKDMVPSSGTVLVKDRYDIVMTAPASARSPRSCNGVPPGSSSETWSVTARRHKGFAGKSFKIDASGNLTEIKF